jgi:diketogulonate reductase-like aldo/keto reductase
MVDIKDLFPIGIGAWGHGGFAEYNPDNDDEKQIRALTYQFNKGMNMTEINFWNSKGHSVKLIKEALDRSKIGRDNIFLLQSIYNYYNPTLDDVKREFELCLKTFATDHVDSIQFPLTAVKVYGFGPLTKLIQDYLDQKLTRYVSVTNFNLEYLTKFQSIFGSKIFSHELHFSFEIRNNEDLGIIDFDNNHGIINVIYQPLRRNRTAKQNWPLLAELATKYSKTQNQIILRWLTSRGMLPLVKSEYIEHIDENLAALSFEMKKEGIERMNKFRPPNFVSKKIDWFMEGKIPNSAFIHALPNIFDEEYAKVLNSGKK